MTGLSKIFGAGFLRRSLKARPAQPLRIVVRQSPDWRNTPYDELIEGSRAFCRMIAKPAGISENFISDIVAVWDRTFAQSFFALRAAMEDIAEQNLAAVEQATIATLASSDADSAPPAQLHFFIDDDDWLHPQLYRELQPYLGESNDGYVFGNILCVSQIELRRIDDGCYTNNYAVSARFLRQAGVARVAQHWDANEAFHQPGFRSSRVPLYLSATNKHPASTMKLKDGLQGSELSAERLRYLVERFVDESADAVIPDAAAWVAPYTKQVRRAFAALL